MIARTLALTLVGVLLSGAGEKQPDARIVVIVNIANPVKTMSRERLSMIFLREIVAWDNGDEILPVDQIDKSPARVAFARDVQGQSVIALKRFWQERIFSGNESPPPSRVTDGDVLTYVRSNPGAIGYVLEGSDLGIGVKQVVITDNGRETGAVKTRS